MGKKVRSEIVLIGPMGAGKSTVAKLLADNLGVPEVAMDEHREDYYKEIGYSAEEAQRRESIGGFRSKCEYWKLFDNHALQRLFESYRNCVFHLGAGHSVFEDPDSFRTARIIFEAFANVVLLLPSRDPEQSMHVLRERLLADRPGVDPNVWDRNRHFVENPSNRSLATHVIYTEGRTPSETATDVLRTTKSFIYEAKPEPSGFLL